MLYGAGVPAVLKLLAASWATLLGTVTVTAPLAAGVTLNV